MVPFLWRVKPSGETDRDDQYKGEGYLHREMVVDKGSYYLFVVLGLAVCLMHKP
jgi:hypothetical protein